MSLTSHRRSLTTPRPRSHADDWAFLQEVSEGTVAGPLGGAGGTRDAHRARLAPAASGLPASRVFSSNEHGRCGSFCCVLVSIALTSILIFIVSFLCFLGVISERSAQLFNSQPFKFYDVNSQDHKCILKSCVQRIPFFPVLVMCECLLQSHV